MREPPYRVLASSGHSVGKSLLGACLVLWWHYSRDAGLCLTTAPTDRQVKDILWKEVRNLAERAGLPNQFAGPMIPRLQSSPTHFAHGFTAREATAFQGYHSPGGLLVLFDEAEGVEAGFWTALKTMLDKDSYFVAFYNPTTVGSAAHAKEQEADQFGTFRRINLSSVDHPNIAAELAGDQPPIPGAITLSQLTSMLLEDSDLLSPGEPAEPGDVELQTPQGLVRFRPGPIAEARCLGRRPSTSTTGVWSERLLDQLFANRVELQEKWPVAVGCDVARYGTDQTVLFVRKGLCLLHAESHVRWNTSQTAARLRELCHEYSDTHNPERRIPCLVDEGGIGGGVIDQADGYHFVAINAAHSPRNKDRFLNVRAELSFNARDLVADLDLSRLPSAYRQRLRQELSFFRYKVRPDDRLQVESKDDIKKGLGRSPDVADAFNLCVYPPPVSVIV